MNSARDSRPKVFIITAKKKMQRYRKRNHAPSSSVDRCFPQESNTNRYHKTEEKEGRGTRDHESNSNLEIIDISDDDDDMYLQLSLFNSWKVEKASQIIDRKQKGILSSSPLVSSKLFHKFFQAGESSVTECVIFKQTMSSGEVLRANSKCLHPFCKDCIKNYIGEKLQENIREIKCPEEKCQQLLEKNLWKIFVPERLGWVMEQAKIEGSVLQHPIIFQCPNKDCEELIVDDEKKFLIRACPKCWKLFCASCIHPWHTGMTCVEFQIWKQERLTAQIREVLLPLSSPQIIFIRPLNSLRLSH